MVLNSLCALTLGFALDMSLGSSRRKFSATGFIRGLINKLTGILKGAYADTPAAQKSAGTVLVFFTLFIVIVFNLLVLMAAYKIHVVLGIVCEGLMCRAALNIRNVRVDCTGIFRSVKNGQRDSAARKLKKFTGKDTSELTLDQITSLAVETIARRTNDFAVAPIFYILLLGGLGGIVYRTIYLLDEYAGHKTNYFIHFGRVPARLKDVMDCIPSRICSKIIILDCYFLGLDGKNAKKVYKSDRKKAFCEASGRTQSAMAGGLGITLDSPEYTKVKRIYNSQEVIEKIPRKKIPIGTAFKEKSFQDIYWAIQLFCGTAAYCMILAALIRIAIAVIL